MTPTGAILDHVLGVRAPLIRGLIITTVALTALHLLAVTTSPVWHAEGVGIFSTMGWWFHLDGEQSLGTWFAVVQLVLAATIAALLALQMRSQNQPWRGWGAIAFLLVMMSIDEQIGVHENFGVIADEFGLPTAGLWFVPALALASIVGVALVPFTINLPARTRRGLLAACALFLTGSVGFEALWTFSPYLNQDPNTSLWLSGLLQMGEETLELLAVTVTIGTLLDHTSVISRAKGEDR